MALSKITSAYNFVPLQAKVVSPEWQNRTSQDVPLQDGACAEIDITVTNHTPLLVGSSRPPREGNKMGEVAPSVHPDGRPVLPGSSVRGMIRNVLEIATASQMYRMDDRRLSVRDLANKDKSLYLQHLTKSEGEGPVRVTPLSRAAWMRFQDGVWQLCHVPHVRVEQSDLAIQLGLDLQKWFAVQKKRTPHEKYAEVVRVFKSAANAGGESLRVYFNIAEARNVQSHLHQKGSISIRYSKVQDVHWQKPGQGYATGRLVVTGQPSDKKHMEFIFQEPQNASSWITLDDALVEDFLRINDTPETMLGDFKGSKNPFGASIGFPVFYLCKPRGEQGPKPKAESSDDILAIGLSQMFRLPYKYSLGETARRQQPTLAEGHLDFARTLFGLVADEVALDDSVSSRRSRVSFGDFRLADGVAKPWEAPEAFTRATVLNGPKPSFYPNYIVQKESGGKLQGRPPKYNTLMEDNAQLRGWKRYPVHAPANVTGVPVPPEGSQPSVQTRLKPLKVGLKFTGRVRLHNVTRAELGAVLWALTWGDQPHLRHSLGMGKPFGFGQVSVSITQLTVRSNDVSQPARDEASAYVQAFQAYMKQSVPQWEGSLRELLAMANPTALGVGQLHPLFLGVGNANEFREAKQQMPPLALQPYSAIR